MEIEHGRSVKAKIVPESNWKMAVLSNLPQIDNHRAMTLISTVTIFYIWYQVLAFENYYDAHFHNHIKPVSWSDLHGFITNRTLVSSDVDGHVVVKDITLQEQDTQISESDTTMESELMDSVDEQVPFQDIEPESETSNEQYKCRKSTNVMFMKTHKTGSDTISGMIMRFGDSNGLSMALPRYSDYDLAYPGQAKKGLFLNDQSKMYNFNLFFLHTIYNRTFFDTIMAPDTRYITIIREPFAQFQSSFAYYKMADKLNLADNPAPLQTYFQTQDTVWREVRDPPAIPGPPYLKNFMSSDLGFPSSADENDLPTVQRFLEKLDSDFNLVMILEHFDESVVMMRRQLCWDLKDVLYVPVNTGRSTKPEVHPIDRTLHKSFSPVDHHLYQYFNTTLWRKIAAEPGFAEEVAYFKDTNAKFVEFCKGASTAIVPLTIGMPASLWSEEFTMDSDLCETSRIFLPDYVHMLKRKLYNEGEAITNPKLWNIV